ncbi:MAG: hypothetical protein ACOY45_07580 [Pseudomonadota bacterium]
MAVRGNRLGIWAAWGAVATAIGYGVPQVMQVLGLLPDPLDRILIFAPSLALATCYTLTLAAAAAQADAEQRGWRYGALALGLLYAGFVSQVYVVQLGVVIPRELAGEAAIPGTPCCGFRLPMTAVDLLGYTQMSLSTLVLAPSFRGPARGWLVANGALAVPIFLQLWWPALLWLGAIWLLTFPVALALVARDLSREARRAE